ncbi:olfactory receptor 1468-like [Eleutherodactylus coqui]|uniref:olfactory receptor 1468-like n=1 Tax=Eleutherodactylus coqui TaxID=57060 RepID=UPI0034626AE0
MVIKLLAGLFCNNPEIRGINAGLWRHKLGLFADDIILTLMDPLASLCVAYRTIQYYGKVSYNLNSSTKLKERFLHRGYPPKILDQAFDFTKKQDRATILKPRTKTLDNILRVIGTYDDVVPFMQNLLRKYWHILKDDPDIKDIIPDGRNLTEVTQFFILGFQADKYVRIILFCLFLVVYCGTLCGNLLIITLVSTSKTLHTPMYFFISQLSISDILLSTDIVPNLLHILLNNGGTITFIGCMTQYYFFCASELFECFLLTVMSYDRYVAICIPLRYASIMSRTCCVTFAIIAWCFSFSSAMIFYVTISMLKFCGPNVIDHFFCDINPLLDIACSDTFIVHLEIRLIGSPLVIIPTILIITSYVKIIVAILRIPSSTGRHKAFSTCSSHLIVVSIFYWTIFSVYIIPKQEQTLNIHKILSLLYTVFTPFINPLIYSLRNNSIKKAAKNLIKCNLFLL